MSKGKLIVIEGTDGSGKTTQTKLLLERLQKEGIAAESLRFPQYETNLFGGLIRECLNGMRGDFIKTDPKIVSTLFACDRFETMPKIKKWLDEGRVVVLDRYVSSNQIHQGGKIKDEAKRKEFLDWLSKVEYGIFNLQKPDMVLYLDVPYELSLKLIEGRKGVKDAADSDPGYLKNSKEAGGYLLAHEASWQRIECMNGDVLKAREDIHEEIWKKTAEIVNK